MMRTMFLKASDELVEDFVEQGNYVAFVLAYDYSKL